MNIWERDISIYGEAHQRSGNKLWSFFFSVFLFWKNESCRNQLLYEAQIHLIIFCLRFFRKCSLCILMCGCVEEQKSYKMFRSPSKCGRDNDISGVKCWKPNLYILQYLFIKSFRKRNQIEYDERDPYRVIDELLPERYSWIFLV